jgi:uncharacterized protein (DUF362 family)
MAAPERHPIYSRDATVVLETGADKLAALRGALEAARFYQHVEAALAASGKPREQFLVALKPNIMTASVREEDSPVYTDPALVEELLAGLRERGFRNLTVVESRNVYDYSYQGRGVRAVAAMAGYSADGYRIEDLSEQPVPFDYGGVLGRHPIGRTWLEADYRISFAKNKTHWQCFYTGCLKNVYGCLPAWDKMRWYHGKGVEFYQCCILMLAAAPVHFGLLDAWVSGDGFTGHVRDASPNRTRTIFASDNVVALDWVQGEQMALDPTCNVVIREAMRRWILPRITVQGDTAPWQPWTNVQPYVVAGLDVLEEVYWLQRFCSRAFAHQQDPRFPPVSAAAPLFRVIHRVTHWMEPLFESPT